MRTGRPTTDPKETNLKVRINENMNKHLESRAKRLGITKSEYLRRLIEKDMREK